MTKNQAIELIKQTRLKKGISSEAAALVAGINQSTWSRAENGERATSWETIFSMARGVGLKTTIKIADR